MPLLGTILKQTMGIKKRIDNVNQTLDKLHLRRDAYSKQRKSLKKLLTKAQYTEFGKFHHFGSILQTRDFVKGYQKIVPACDYDIIYDKWWHRTLRGEENICWPGQIKYFALSSGTSGASSKYIPITKDALNCLKRTSIKQLGALAYCNLPEEHFEKGFLMVGGSTELKKNATGFEGDLSGITTGNLPTWFQRFYKPGSEISRERDWNTKIEKMVKSAPNWDIAFVAGVPAWIQLLFEKIIKHYNVKTIHDIWPNLSVFIHGGVAFEPYRKAFEKLVARPLTYLDTYLASEGFIAYQARPEYKGMRLSIGDGIFYEFVPFNEDNFDNDGQLKSNPQALSLQDVEEGVDYALLISTMAGAWRYLIGDTVRFIDLEKCEVIITGRTKQFLSLCGEHLSVDNMTQALNLAANELNVSIPEYTVCGIPHDGMFGHHWYIGTNDKVDGEVIRTKIDEHLKILNDDYAVERKSALKEIIVEVLPLTIFYDYMQKIGKMGSQNKFPRVLKGDKMKAWQSFVDNRR